MSSAFSPVLEGLRPVFVVGHPRSGTTLVQQLLSAHPAFWSAPETHLFSHVLERTPEWDRQPLHADDLPTLFARLAAKPGISLPDAAKDEVTAQAARGELGAAHLLDAVMRALKPLDSDAVRWLEKTPKHVYHIPQILALFPDARVIHVLRDPHDVASSPVRFGELEPGLARSMLVIERGESWNAVVAITDALAAEVRLITVRYEDIIAEPEAALARMMEHVGVEVDVTALDRFGDTYRQVTVEKESIRKQLNSAGQIIDRRGVYRQRMTPQEIQLIDTLCAVNLQAKGYTVEHPPAPELVASLRAQAQSLRPAARTNRSLVSQARGWAGRVVRRFRSRWKTLRRQSRQAWMQTERKIRPLRMLRRRLTRYNADVFFVSFPKSGRTWVRFVLGRAIQMHHGIAPERKLVLDSSLYSLATRQAITITHNFGAREDTGYGGDDKRGFKGKRVFLLSRDIRDTLISYYHHRYDRHGEVEMSLSEYIRSPVFGVEKIAGFYKSWYDNQHLPGEFLRVRYEDLRREPLTGMRRIADFLGLAHIPDQVLEAACAEGDFANMKRLEEQNAIVLLHKSGDAAEMEDDAKRVRKGKVGGFREEMTADDLAYIEQVVTEVGVPRDWVFYDSEDQL